VSQSQANDQIVLGTGTFDSFNCNLNLTNVALTVIGAGIDATTIDCGLTGTCFNLSVVGHGFFFFFFSSQQMSTTSSFSIYTLRPCWRFVSTNIPFELCYFLTQTFLKKFRLVIETDNLIFIEQHQDFLSTHQLLLSAT